MKKTMCLTLFVLVAVLNTNVLQAGEKIRLTTGEWPPYISTGLKHDGVLSLIVTEAFKRENVEITYEFLPWKRAYILARDGKTQGSFAWTKSREREKDFFFSEPFVQNQSVFFHRKDSPFDWKSIEDLKGLKVGGTLQYNYGKKFTDAESRGRIKVERVSTDETNFKKLLGKRIDIFICNLDVGYSLLNKMYDKATVDLITNHPKPVNQDGLCLVLNKKESANAILVETFNNGLEKLKADGSLEKYLEASREGKYKL